METLIKKKILDKYKISPNQFFYLYLKSKNKNAANYITDSELSDLSERNFIKIDVAMNVVSVRRSALEIFKDEETDVKNWIQEYRNVFKGIKPGSMGDSLACLTKMNKFLKVYPEYDKDIIIKAAQLYVETLEDYRYLQRADYFISKADVDRVKESRLASFCEEVKEGNSPNNSTNTTYL